jgi:hypothetical protein
MKKLIITTVFSVFALMVFAQVKVKAYYRKDGTYVQEHYRSNPDGDIKNNWSYSGNVNPYTGKIGTLTGESYNRTSTYNYTYKSTYSNSDPLSNYNYSNSSFNNNSSYYSNKKIVLAKKLNIRSTNSTTGQILGFLTSGQQVKVLSECSNNWVLIEATIYDFISDKTIKIQGFVCKAYII